MREDPAGGSNEQLSERERLVLQALIDAHIATAEPVGSRSLAEMSEIGVSPATIRNVLAALHDKGLIEQPHTSAGRVPTDRGLRYYVDCLLHLQEPSANERKEIHSRIGEAASGAVEGALREASKVLTRLARHTTVVVTKPREDARLKHLELVRLRDDAVLLIVVTDEGKVLNRLLEWRDGSAPDAFALERVAKRLTELVEGRTFDEGRALLLARMEGARAELEALEHKLLALSAENLKANAVPEIHVEGASHLLETTRNIERTKELLELLDEGGRVKAVLEHAMRAPGIRIFIGEENPASALYERTVVTVSLGPSGALGVLGVIGPRHLDYARVVPLVDLTAQVVARTVQG